MVSIKLNGYWATPIYSCALLAGVYLFSSNNKDSDPAAVFADPDVSIAVAENQLQLGKVNKDLCPSLDAKHNSNEDFVDCIIKLQSISSGRSELRNAFIQWLATSPEAALSYGLESYGLSFEDELLLDMLSTFTLLNPNHSMKWIDRLDIQEAQKYQIIQSVAHKLVSLENISMLSGVARWRIDQDIRYSVIDSLVEKFAQQDAVKVANWLKNEKNYRVTESLNQSILNHLIEQNLFFAEYYINEVAADDKTHDLIAGFTSKYIDYASFEKALAWVKSLDGKQLQYAANSLVAYGAMNPNSVPMLEEVLDEDIREIDRAQILALFVGSQDPALIAIAEQRYSELPSHLEKSILRLIAKNKLEEGNESFVAWVEQSNNPSTARALAVDAVLRTSFDDALTIANEISDPKLRRTKVLETLEYWYEKQPNLALEKISNNMDLSESVRSELLADIRNYPVP